MKLRSKCEGCHKTRWFIKKRVYKVKNIEYMTSKSLLCRTCYKGILKMIKFI